MRALLNKLCVCVCAATAAATLAAAPAAANEAFGVEKFENSAVNKEGLPVGQAGSHPYAMTTTIIFDHHYDQAYQEGSGGNGQVPNGDPKSLEVNLPAGLIVDPTATEARCTEAELEHTGCPDVSAVGVVSIYHGNVLGGGVLTSPVYDMVPQPGLPGELGFNASGAGVLVHIAGSVRTGSDYGVTARVSEITQKLPIDGTKLTLWGDPSAASHDIERGVCVITAAADSCPVPRTGKTFLTLPSRCSGPLTASVRAQSWQEPSTWTPPLQSSPPLRAIEGCDQLHFEPTLEARPTTDLADSPTGLSVDLHVPQEEAAAGFATPALRDTVVTLPRGLVVNPSSANGLAACTPAQFGLTSAVGLTPITTTAGRAECPDSSKLGTVEVTTPLLDHPLPGAVYLAEPYEKNFHFLLALYIAIHDPKTGVVVKLAGHAEADPQTGRLTTTFAENPQLPFEDFKLRFFDGPRAPLRTPALCGSYETTSQLTPWSAPQSGSPATPSDAFDIAAGVGGACAHSATEEPHSPAFTAGTLTPEAGAYSPFVLHLARSDGSQELSKIDMTLPPGLTGRLAGIPSCSDAALAAAAARSGRAEQVAPSCSRASEVGVVNVAAGAGPAPYWAQGRAYLAGPYRGAPLSLAVITPALAGPFDLGTVVVRNALHVDPVTAQITAVSDPIPHILDGIPLDIRKIDLRLDRPRFTLNPTSCEPMSVGGSLLSTLGQTAALTDPFQVGECARLGFKPKLSLSLEGKPTRGAHPRLRAVLTMPQPGVHRFRCTRHGKLRRCRVRISEQANIARAQVTLPHLEFLDQGHIRTVCTRVQFAARECPAGSIYGFARAWTPLLDKPLEGPVYLRSSSHELPDLAAALKGPPAQPLEIDLDGRVDSVHGGIRNTFEVVPDAPVTKFVLSMQGGRKGLIVNSENLCGSTHRATAKFNAQNGRRLTLRPALRARCPKRHAKKHRRHRRKTRRQHRRKRGTSK